VQVLPYGDHETEKGTFRLDEEAMTAVVEDFSSRRNDMVIDYEHQTLSGGEAPAAGWIRKLFAVVPGGSRGDAVPPRPAGLWAMVEWTEKAKEYLANREYRYLSPVFLKRLSDGRVLRLLNAALTNQPAIDGMVPIVNKRDAYPHDGDAVHSGSVKREEEKSMDKLLKVLGLPEGATEDEAEEAVTAMKEDLSALKGQGRELRNLMGLKEDAGLPEVTGTLEAMRQAHVQSAELLREVSELRTKLMRKEAGELVAAAMKQGKVTPAQRDWALSYAERDPEGFKVFAAKAAVVVRTGEVAGARLTAPGALGSADEFQVQVNKALGIDEEAFRRHNR
jgi:phage I-like protein